MVFNTTGPNPILPFSIYSALPHLNWPIGLTLDGPESPSISACIDLAAALNTGNYHKLSQIVRQFPSYLAGVYTGKGYEPIVLSGIVQDRGAAVTTKLPVAFLFHTLYLTVDGMPTLLGVACGP